MNMFSNNKKELKNIDEENAKIDQKVELYRQSQTIQVDRTIEDYRRARFMEVEKLAVTCIEDTTKYEHEFHSAKETKGIELAGLDAEIKNKQEILADIKKHEETRAERDLFKAKSEASTEIIASKDKTIELLDGIVKVVVGKLSKVDVGSLAVHVAPVKSEE